MQPAVLNIRAVILIALLLFPAACSSNGWISGVNAFRRTPDFFVLFAAIVC
jgi:hypothetical protein